MNYIVQILNVLKNDPVLRTLLEVTEAPWGVYLHNPPEIHIPSITYRETGSVAISGIPGKNLHNQTSILILTVFAKTGGLCRLVFDRIVDLLNGYQFGVGDDWTVKKCKYNYDTKVQRLQEHRAWFWEIGFELNLIRNIHK